jgi:Coenzyme PQQ synthesis protein D (PqqD)
MEDSAALLSLRPRRHPDLAWRNWGGQVVILAPAGHEPEGPEEQRDGAEHDLNEVGSRLWELCDGARTVGELALALVSEFEVDLATAQRDSADFVRELVRRKLLVVAAVSGPGEGVGNE